MSDTIGFIGAGNMGKAMIEGICKKEKQRNIFVCDHHEDTLAYLENNYNVRVSKDVTKVAMESDILFLCVKPKDYKNLIQTISKHVKEHVIIVDIAAGITIQNVKDFFGFDIKVVKAMPNTPALVQEAMSAISFDSCVTQEEQDKIYDLFTCFGKCEVVDESMMDAITCVSGSSPAYVFMMIEAMADGAVKQGLPRKQAYIFAAQTLLGSAKMVLETNEHPAVLKDRVCSPAGTTIEAVQELERTGFRSSILSAMEVCARKSKEMTKEK